MKEEDKSKTAGIRELKAQLSRYINMVRRGGEVIITDHREEVAVILPVSPERKRILELVVSGAAKWDGGKPEGIHGITIKGKPLSITVLEERV